MRRTTIALAACGIAAAFSAAPAAGQGAPPTMPTRDVAVTYRTAGERNTGEARISWLTAEQRMRMEQLNVPADRAGAVVLDMRNNRVTILMDAQRMYVEGPADEDRGAGLGLVGPEDRATREGQDRVAGLACTVWRIEPAPGAMTEEDEEEDEEVAEEEQSVKRACITADGVPLRIVELRGGQEHATTVAQRVEYGPQDPARFRVPEGWRPFDPSSLVPGGGAERRR